MGLLVVPMASWRAREENRFQEATHSPLRFLLFQNGYKGQASFPVFSPLYLMFRVPPGLGCQSPGRGIRKEMSLTALQTKKGAKQQL